VFVTGFESPIQALVVFSDPKHEVDARLVRAREAARSYPLGRARKIRVLPSNEVISDCQYRGEVVELQSDLNSV
jgi:hypothetical protein